MAISETASDPGADRQAALESWLHSLPSLKKRRWRLCNASADASFRRYLRLHFANGTLIVMDAPPGREPLAAWLDIRRRLAAAGIKVPEVHAVDETNGFVLLEDFGSLTLNAALVGGDRNRLYGAAFDTLSAMQLATADENLPPYDESRLRDELELFPRWFIERHLDIKIECGVWDLIENAFRLLLNDALAQPKVFVHRDYHSRNLMVLGPPAGRRSKIGVIDFQDAVRGPVTYDLVSLLKDCYITPDRAWREIERRRHWQRLRAFGKIDCPAETFARWHEMIGLQRHIKVLGIFCRLCYRDGKAAYLGYLPKVLSMTLEAAAAEPRLSEFAHWLATVCRDRDLTRPRSTVAERGR